MQKQATTKAAWAIFILPELFLLIICVQLAISCDGEKCVLLLCACMEAEIQSQIHIASYIRIRTRIYVL